jgi:nitrite reductase/ring-hydroxylating ferredoxin subunit
MGTPQRLADASVVASPSRTATAAYINATVQGAAWDANSMRRRDPKDVIVPLATGGFAEGNEAIWAAIFARVLQQPGSGYVPIDVTQPSSVPRDGIGALSRIPSIRGAPASYRHVEINGTPHERPPLLPLHADGMLQPPSGQSRRGVLSSRMSIESTSSSLDRRWFEGDALDEDSDSAPASPHSLDSNSHAYMQRIPFPASTGRVASGRVAPAQLPLVSVTNASASPKAKQTAQGVDTGLVSLMTLLSLTPNDAGIQRTPNPSGGAGTALLADTPLVSLLETPPAEDVVLWLTSSIHVDSLIDASLYPIEYFYTVTGLRKRLPRTTERPQLGRRATLNGRDVAVFKYRGAIFAFSAKCPHAGGQLELGDIEEFSGHTCVCCPMHGFLFDCSTTGTSVSPQGTYHLQLFPSRVAVTGNVEIGFSGIDASAFTNEDF